MPQDDDAVERALERAALPDKSSGSTSAAKADRRVLAREVGRLAHEWLNETPPSDLDAERALLGSLILDPTLIPKVRPLIDAAHFHADDHGRLYDCLLEMDKNGIDAVTIKARLRSRGNWEAVGGAAYIAEVAQSVPYAANWRDYLDIVLNCYARRRVLSACLDLAKSAHCGQRSPDQLCRVGTKLFDRMAEWLKARGLSD